MQSEVTVSPPNSLVLVVTASDAKTPDSMSGELVASTSTCVAVGTLGEVDGETTIRLTSERPDEAEEGLTLVFEGTLISPDGFVSVMNVKRDTYLHHVHPKESVTLRIWANDSTEPDLIVVEVPCHTG